MARIRIKSTLSKEITMEEAERLVAMIDRYGKAIHATYGDDIAESVDMQWDEVDLELFDDDGRVIEYE